MFNIATFMIVKNQDLINKNEPMNEGHGTRTEKMLQVDLAEPKCTFLAILACTTSLLYELGALMDCSQR